MSWIIIVVVSICVLILLFYFFPSLRKLFSIKSSGSKKPSLRKAKLEEKRKAKENKAQEKERKKLEKLNAGGTIINNEGDLFSDNPQEDPDTKVNYDNLNFDGLFQDDMPKPKPKNSKEDSEDFQEFLNKYFSDDKKTRGPRKGLNTSFTFKDDSDDESEADEISDYLQNYDPNEIEDDEIKKQLDKMPPEIKALIISNFLDSRN